MMQSYDHFPHSDFDTLRAAHAALIADIAGMLLTVPLPGGTPARDAPVAPALPPTRFVKFGDALICTECRMDSRYCRGHTPPPPAQGDGESSSLNKRVKDCQAR